MSAGLRFDRVVLRVLRDLRAALRDSVPPRHTVIVTVTAPIRLPAKTVTAVAEKVSGLLARQKPVKAGFKGIVHGNGVRVRIVNGCFGREFNVLGYVHNPDVDADALLDAAEALLRLTQASAACTSAKIPRFRQ